MVTSSVRPIRPHRTGKLTVRGTVDGDWLMYKNEMNQLMSYPVNHRVKQQLYMLASIVTDVPSRNIRYWN